MATPTSHPNPNPNPHRPSPSKSHPQPTASNHLTPPTNPGASPLPFNSAHSTRTHPSPLTSTTTPVKRPFAFTGSGVGAGGGVGGANGGHARGPSSGGHPMSRQGTNQSATPGSGAGAGMGGQAMARSGTNQSAISANTPTPSGSGIGTGMVRSATGMTTGGMSGISAAGDSPAVSAAVGMLMESLNSGQGAGKGTGVGLGVAGMGLTPSPGMGMGMGMGKTGLTPASISGGQGMGVGVGGGLVGLSALQQEEERKRRIGVVAEMVGKRWGFVSQSGVESAAKRLGLECLWEEGMGDGKRGLSIAGEGLLVEIAFEGEEVKGLHFDLPGAKWAGGDAEGKRKGGEVLMRCLGSEDEEAPFVRMEKFVGNLERLARMDKLGGEGGVKFNCFDAVEGVHRSLRLVYEKEMEGERQKQKARFQQAVMCSRNGRPVVHEGQRVGLALQFWRNRRLLSELESNDDAMDVDGQEQPELGNEEEQIWSAVIECEACPADVYTPARVSEKWVQENTDSMTDGNALHIADTDLSWLEPPGDLQIPTDGTTGDHKSPNLRFIAKFEPPIVLPLPVALQLHESFGSPIAQNSILPTTYDALLFFDLRPLDPLDTAAPRTFETTIRSYNAATKDFSTYRHRSNLYTAPQDFGRILTDLPFRHPMQLSTLLPTLRQWAVVGSILKRSFASTPEDEPRSPNVLTTDGDINASNGHVPSPPAFQSLEDELADFLSSPLPGSSIAKLGEEDVRNVDIIFSASPLPQFQIQFANPAYSGKVTGVQFSVGPEGVIEVVDMADGKGAIVEARAEGDVDAQEAVRDKMRLKEKVKKVLEVSEDLGVLIEWLARQ
ncbi:uncharacterized protein KY384_006167 [Bacidia gigantensis]|uniref:uncharacterized protein n=1 Tax=Bacidia gigantensis TaxID=2732470 RepID=UPI001D0569D8|nr:uncharacterized protein KY384_006167 [Bacidia gigantensis]KAG8529530.1 hypothetical protein KY384_006167 [Bacidia gigantensis]